MADHPDDAQRPSAAEDDTQATSSSGSVVEGGSTTNKNVRSQLPSIPGSKSGVRAKIDAEVDDQEDTVLTSAPQLQAEEFAQGLSPRELSVLLEGQLLDHFHLQEYIGGGGMGAVFKALDTTLDRIVAVKVVASQSISSEDLQRRFLVEAQSTARLDHPNIARIHFVGHDRGLPYIVFEYIDGVNLRDMVVNHGPMPVGDALNFTCQIAHALAHAWQKEVVHRDIKPSNILINHEQQAKLVDMGLARFSHVETTEHELTNTGMTLGTFDYISPEQARDPRDADTRSDIYSLGCTLFYMLAGRAPFAKGTAVQKLLQHQDQTPPKLTEFRPDIPQVVSQLVDRMLAKSPSQRPQTPSELVGTCYQIFQSLGLQPPQSLPPLPLTPQVIKPTVWRKHVPWMLPLTALLVAGAFWTTFTPDPTEAVVFTKPLPRLSKPIVPEASPSEELSKVNAEPESDAAAPVPPVVTAEVVAGSDFTNDEVDFSFDFQTPLANPGDATDSWQLPIDELFGEPENDLIDSLPDFNFDDSISPQ